MEYFYNIFWKFQCYPGIIMQKKNVFDIFNMVDFYFFYFCYNAKYWYSDQIELLVESVHLKYP